MNFRFTKDNTYCISLHDHSNRWEKMVRRFHDLNMEVTRLKATTISDLEGCFGKDLNTLQKCCASSHVNAWKLFLKSNNDYVLILEDDACFDKEWRSKLDKFQFNSFDLILLNASEPITPLDTWCITHENYLTGGYIISRNGVEQLLDMFQNCYYTSDWMTSRLQQFSNSYTYFPWLIIQDGKESTIGSDVNADHNKVKRCLTDVNYSFNNYII